MKMLKKGDQDIYLWWFWFVYLYLLGDNFIQICICICIRICIVGIMGKIPLHNQHRCIDKCLKCHQIANCKLIRIDSWRLGHIYRRIRMVLARFIRSIFHRCLILGLMENSSSAILDLCIHLSLLHKHSTRDLFSWGHWRWGQE